MEPARLRGYRGQRNIREAVLHVRIIDQACHEPIVGIMEMLAHCLFRKLRVLRCNRLMNDTVFGDRHLPIRIQMVETE